MDSPNNNTLNEKSFMDRLYYYIHDDQLRLVFIVILLIGLILLVTGIRQAILFMLVAFGILAFLCVFKPKPSLREDFICDSFYDIDDEFSKNRFFESSRMEEEIGITIIQKSENRNNKFKNSTRN
jgi:uncharacterized membrane protein